MALPLTDIGSNETEEIELKLLLEAIYVRYHYDFRSYSLSSIQRRLRRARDDLGCATLSCLQERLLRDAALFTRLLDYLTVQVSDLFRDPDYYRYLRTEVIPVLRTYPSCKVWVAGCSTGEELYSFAILLREEGLLERTILYATDINLESLERAKAGIYDLDRIATFSENYTASGGAGSLSTYYTAAYGRAVFDRSLREGVVFSDHSLATDSVFAEVQLISCRNVLIYFDRELQDRTVGLFAESLCRRGFLGLGSTETLRFSAHADLFTELSEDARVYRKNV